MLTLSCFQYFLAHSMIAQLVVSIDRSHQELKDDSSKMAEVAALSKICGFSVRRKCRSTDV